MSQNVLIFFLLVLTTVSGDPDNICTKCDCSNLEDPKILKISCSNRGIQNITTEWPQRNQTEIQVSYVGNNIPTLDPLPGTNNRVEIILASCNIRYLRPDLFTATKNIMFVDFSHNLLTAEEVSAEKFRGPYNESANEPLALEQLDLSYNQIHSLGKNLFEHMPNLKVLNLEGNDFTVLDIHTQLALSSIKGLQKLNLANNDLTEMIEGAIERHENLTELDLSFNDLDFVPRSLVQIGKSLQNLKLDSNPIFEFTADTFLGLDNIVELSCNNLTNLKYINANTFASMPKLKNLSVSNNLLLTDIDREAFGINQTLEEFYLTNNKLFKIDYKLLPWPKLHVFDFTENSFDCSCDLYRITAELSYDIKRKEGGPMCRDPRYDHYVRVFYLKEDICDYKPVSKSQKELIQYHFSIVRVSLIVLGCFVMVIALMSAVFAYFRCVRLRREQNYSYTSHISYNPVATTARF